MQWSNRLRSIGGWLFYFENHSHWLGTQVELPEINPSPTTSYSNHSGPRFPCNDSIPTASWWWQHMNQRSMVWLTKGVRSEWWEVAEWYENHQKIHLFCVHLAQFRYFCVCVCEWIQQIRKEQAGFRSVRMRETLSMSKMTTDSTNFIDCVTEWLTE